MSTELTATEQALIAAAAPKRDPQGGLSPLFATVDDIVAARMADVWEEACRSHALKDDRLDAPCPANPYRATKPTEHEETP